MQILFAFICELRLLSIVLQKCSWGSCILKHSIIPLVNKKPRRRVAKVHIFFQCIELLKIQFYIVPLNWERNPIFPTCMMINRLSFRLIVTLLQHRGCKSQIRKIIEFKICKESMLVLKKIIPQINKQYLISKLTSSAKIRDLSEVTEAHSLASGGFGSDWGQNEKNLRRKF